jgi:2-polyprenyl-3-methyl-5-hydroxy-6-metoxy-1,4-benzoquinol methylase
MVMRPDDLIAFSRRTYSSPGAVNAWSDPDVVKLALTQEETTLLENMPLTSGRLLLLGAGGGREAFPLARRNFSVTVVDFVPELVVRTKEIAAQQGIHVEGLVQEISNLDVPRHTYDVVWLSASMYSCVPTRKRRVTMLRKICHALKPGGYFICQFHWASVPRPSRSTGFLRHMVAWITLGNLTYEPGDMLWGNGEFIHAFSSEEEIRREFAEGGFEVDTMHFWQDRSLGGALLKRSESAGHSYG